MQKKMGADGLHNLLPPCTHPHLEVRNAELYDYWCPNAQRCRELQISGTFFHFRGKIVLTKTSVFSADPNRDPNHEICGNAQTPPDEKWGVLSRSVRW